MEGAAACLADVAPWLIGIGGEVERLLKGFPWRGAGTGGFLSVVFPAISTPRWLATSSLSNSCDVRGVSVTTGAKGSHIEYCDMEAVSALLLLLSLVTAGRDDGWVDASVVCSAANPDSPVIRSLLKASTSKAGRDDLSVLHSRWPPSPNAGNTADRRGRLANLAKVSLTVSGWPYPLLSPFFDPRAEFLRVFSSNSSSTSSRSPSDKDVWKGFKANARAYGATSTSGSGIEAEKVACLVSSGEEA